MAVWRLKIVKCQKQTDQFLKTTTVGQERDDKDYQNNSGKRGRRKLQRPGKVVDELNVGGKGEVELSMTLFKIREKRESACLARGYNELHFR